MTDATLSANKPMQDSSEGMSYLNTLPRRVVTVYVPLLLILLVLLFPFYWMVITAVKPKEHLLRLNEFSPWYTLSPTFEHIRA
ncbi:MAG: carbohydrate ABC transporter permease, partial [Beijerinckiaceae bacterium]